MDGRNIRISELNIGSVFESEKSKIRKKDALNFADILKQAIGEVNQLQKEAKQVLEDFASGKEENIEKVVATIERADVALRMLTEVRNRAIEAYQEIMRMQV